MNERPPEPQDLILVGATGDLAQRKLLPALYGLHTRGLLPPQGAIIGYARSELEQTAFHDLVAESIRTHADLSLDEHSWKTFCDRLRYVSGRERGLAGVTEHVRLPRRLVYLATPPSAFAGLVKELSEHRLVQGTRLLVEKPFGYDLASARELDHLLHAHFDEDQIFRIDHYLGKETVQNILVFRFGNSIFERLWNRDVIDHMQITVAESEGVGTRAEFYEETGALRDIIQNHVFQVLALLTMEPPASFEPGAVHDEKQKVLRAIPKLDPHRVVLGQYTAGTIDGRPVPGYRDEPGVDPKSRTETFAALRVSIDNWRWSGVPFYLRSGKRLHRKATEVHVQFREAPVMPFLDTEIERLQANHITLRIQPEESIALTFIAKEPGPELQARRVRMDFNYAEHFRSRRTDDYERLLLDAMEDDRMLFIRGDTVERAWEVVQPILDAMPAVYTYPAGSWGPDEARELIEPRTWHLH